MKRTVLLRIAALCLVLAAVAVTVWRLTKEDLDEESRYKNGETEVVVSNLSRTSLTLFKAGRNLDDTAMVSAFDGKQIWLKQGNYFLKSGFEGRSSFFPIPLMGYRGGPDENGSLVVTIRQPPKEYPPRLLRDLPEFVFIPSGSFLLGNRVNPREPHYVWLTGFFVAPFEVSNAEFREFVDARDGFSNDTNWTNDGRRWKSTTLSHSTARLNENDTDYRRFGQPDQPVTWVSWFEANAYCKWLTRKIGNNRWLFALPTDAEWEKAARGPDNLDYALSMSISDNEVPLYNWKKNPDNPVTVVGIHDSPSHYHPNRYGLYHMTGNVVEWTQSVERPYSKQQPYADDERNLDNSTGLRTARGGSWYSASIAYLHVPYRDSFQPEHSTQDIGFRIVARPLP